MKFAQRYVRDCDSSDLTNDVYHSSTDSLGAIALTALMPSASDLGAILFRAKYGSDGACLKNLLVRWREVVAKKASDRKWPPHINTRRVAELSLNYWLYDRCDLCKGRAFQPMKQQPQTLSDDPCPRCKGTGRSEIRCDRRLIDFVTEMVGELEAIASNAAGRAMAKIGKDMEL